MPIIKKILNYSVILIEEESHKESIVLSKGIGFGKKAGDSIELEDNSQLFIPVYNLDGKQLLELLDSIPVEYLQVTKLIVEYAQKELEISFNEHIYLALTDHIHFAVKRMQENLILSNKMFWEFKTFYPTEYAIGLKALDMIKTQIGVSLPKEEAANIAFHIINAKKEEKSGYDALKAAKLIKDIVNLVKYSTNMELNQNSIHYSRFITHMQFFTERFLTGKLLNSEDDFLYREMEEAYPKSIECAEKVRTMVLKENGVLIPNEEIAYLAVYIERLTSRK